MSSPVDPTATAAWEQLTELAENPTEAELIARLEEAAWPLTSRTLTTEEIVADLRAARGE